MKSFFKNMWLKIKNYFNPNDELKRKMSPLFTVLVVLSTVAMLISNIVCAKTFSLFGWSINGCALNLTCGVLVFPITYVLSDLFSEVYGFGWSRKTCWIAFLSNLLMVGIFQLSIIMPGTDATTSAAFASILGATPMTLVASLCAWLVGDLLNDIVFQKLKRKALAKGNKSVFAFASRAIISSFVGEVTDSIVFLPILYLNLFLSFGIPYPPVWALLVMVLIQALTKTLYEICIVPLTVFITKKVQKYEDSENWAR